MLFFVLMHRCRQLGCLLLLSVLSSCLGVIKPVRNFTAYKSAPAPDYAQQASWAALPTHRDSADAVPKNSGLRDQQATAPADVFFIHLTTLIRPQGWNGASTDPALNLFTDQFSIRRQASVFNAAGRIYAPRYRQAALYSFFDADSSANARAALALAYQDVKTAFQYYLDHYNQGRPIILAGHSQGSFHAQRLLHDFFDQDPKRRGQLVAAYLVGFKVNPNAYQNLRPCEDSTQTNCFISWNTGEWGYSYEPYRDALAINPLTWTRDTAAAPASLNRGSVPQSFNRIDKEVADAKVHDGVLWVHPPATSGYPRFLIPGRPELRHSFHIADYGLYYMNVRENAVARVRAWQQVNQ
ncbi:conserved hypothetical protein [Hymenobacter roseosalivarius DSM 11622]|uniref:DUF3089 domain-containing protein n=1 Tax=Hymenobacter roseosalivarius DSM 11622 TaxID=645990 RepID=A0A1W1VT57_9BACT|nr:conserved hypothetical protein [Hymenobacter roseosalivarius DSM 11622]